MESKIKMPESLISYDEEDEKLSVPVEYVFWLKYELNKINLHQLDKIKFSENGKKLEIDNSIIEEFKFTGLNNTDFILTDFHNEN